MGGKGGGESWGKLEEDPGVGFMVELEFTGVMRAQGTAARGKCGGRAEPMTFAPGPVSHSVWHECGRLWRGVGWKCGKEAGRVQRAASQGMWSYSVGGHYRKTYCPNWDTFESKRRC